jgi:hypothetical protein
VTPLHDAPTRPGRDLWIALVAFGVYLLLGQRTLYNRDAHVLLLAAHQGAWLHNHHLLFFPGLNAVSALAAPLGLGLYRAALAYSALGVAVGVAFTQAAHNCLRLGRREALLATSLVAACPAVLFFATVVEVHGPFFAFAGASFWAAARFASAPTAARGALLGALTGAAALAHATGMLLPVILLPLAWTLAPGARPALRHGAVALAAQLTVALATPAILRALGHLPGGDETAAGHLALRFNQLAATEDLAFRIPYALGLRTVKEWLWPYLPLSVAGFAALGIPRLRRRALLFALALGTYLAVATILLWPFWPNHEHGAYLLPLAWPAALLIVAAWPPQGRLAILAVSLAVAVAQVAIHDRPERSRSFAEGLRNHAGDTRPFVIVGYYDDVEALLIHLLEDTEYLALQQVLPAAPEAFPAIAAKLDRKIAQVWGEGRPVYLTEDAHAALANPFFAAQWPLCSKMLSHLQERYRLEPVNVLGFRGFVVQLRD